ncbi:Rv3654c family TadE-like protein [Actinoplanes auranticolor]|uniref:Rv3654c family TadE-like protein n=1 Tax=Actinoplanes auranticolor TaxID=47988 RepID=UPI001FE358AF|nr:Rv3654c family TadE-like protein [Actinoplanes auranticolor]
MRRTRCGPAADGPVPDLERDRGAASIFVLALGLVLVAAGIAGAAVGAARVGRHQARTAADLGALAGAARAVEGAEVACARAERFAVANGARMRSCRLDGLEIVIDVQIIVTPLPGLVRSASTAARAGPVSIPAG